MNDWQTGVIWVCGLVGTAALVLIARELESIRKILARIATKSGD